MASIYSAFLQQPNTSHLANDASINYITTTTVVNEPAAIIKHLQAQLKQVTKKEEKVLNAIEGPDSLLLETETTLQFNRGGGAYLPSMDDNLLDEKLVTLPIIHVVNFDGAGKIKQIRLHWDSGTLLKQVEAIGRTGRNWPIKDGKAQVDTIIKSLRSTGIEPSSKVPLGSRNPNEVAIGHHQRADSVSATRDPHASLDLFARRDPNAEPASAYDGPKLAPRASAKPAPRDMGELFAGGEATSGVPGSNARSSSPSKADGVILKSGAGKNYTGNRIFDENDKANAPRSPERKKTYDQKYQHFAFGDGEDVADKSRPTSSGRNSKGHKATFSFEDFSTPPKYQGKPRPDDELHWGADDPPSPPKREVVHAARKDADTHFAFTDASSPALSGKAMSLQRQRGMDLYDDNTVDEPVKNVAAASTAVKSDNSRRGDDFGAHYSMTDVQAQNENAVPNKGATRFDMSQHWSHESPPAEKRIYKTAGDGMGGRKGAGFNIGEEDTEKRIYKTYGDGMGGRRTAGGRNWGIGDDSDPEVNTDVRPSARSRRAQAQAGAAAGF